MFLIWIHFTDDSSNEDKNEQKISFPDPSSKFYHQYNIKKLLDIYEFEQLHRVKFYEDFFELMDDAISLSSQEWTNHQFESNETYQ